MIWKAIKMKKYIHYGSNKFDKDKVKSIENRQYFNKPRGGLWACSVDSDYDWKDFVTENDMGFDVSESFCFELKPDSRILKLHSKDDFYKMADEYCIKCDILLSMLACFDFERIATDYDVIDYRVRELYHELYGWDFDSILVLNPDVVKEMSL